MILLVLIFIKPLQSVTLVPTDCVKNDDFCDCGNDEQNTSACSFFSKDPFYCQDSHFVKQSFPYSRVRDSVCDCCDGSDEEDGLCPHVCEELGSNAKTQAEEARALRIRGLMKLNESLSVVKNQFNEIIELGDVSRQALLGMNEKMEKVRGEILNEERKEKEHIESLFMQKKIEYENLFYERLTEQGVALTQSLSWQILPDAIAAAILLSGESAVESILKSTKGLYVSAGPDPDETEALYLCMKGRVTSSTSKTAEITESGELLSDGITSRAESVKRVEKMREALALSRLSERTIRSLYPYVVTIAQDKGVLFSALEIVGVDPSRSLPASIPPYPTIDTIRIQYRNNRLEQLRSDLAAMEQELIDHKQRVEQADSVTQIDFGPDLILLPLWKKCFRYFDREYSYNICPFKTATQGGTLLGSYTGYSYKNNKLKLKFRKGLRCATLPHRPFRRLTVYVECADEEDIRLLEETDVCVYKAWLKSPVACIGLEATQE